MSTQAISPPTYHLRRLAVTVEEPHIGDFYWAIIESTDDMTVWLNHTASKECFTSWLAAWMTGNKELLRFVNDKKTGPLSPGENESDDPMG